MYLLTQSEHGSAVKPQLARVCFVSFSCLSIFYHIIVQTCNIIQYSKCICVWWTSISIHLNIKYSYTRQALNTYTALPIKCENSGIMQEVWWLQDPESNLFDTPHRFWKRWCWPKPRQFHIERGGHRFLKILDFITFFIFLFQKL